MVKSDGSVWFTDPPFGIVGYYQGEQAEQQLPAAVYRIDPIDGHVALVTDAVNGPNGLAFSPDESQLYIVESRAQPRNLLAFDLNADGTGLLAQRVLFDAGEGTPDGFRVDVHGNLWCGWGMGTAQLDGVGYLAARRIVGAHCIARAVRQSMFWRFASESPVHGVVYVHLFTVRQYARDCGYLTT